MFNSGIPISAVVSEVNFPTATRPVALDAQLSKCQTQLQGWTHSSSANTPEGKAKIAALQQQLKDLQTQIQHVDAQSPSDASADAGSGLTPSQAAQSRSGMDAARPNYTPYGVYVDAEV